MQDSTEGMSEGTETLYAEFHYLLTLNGVPFTACSVDANTFMTFVFFSDSSLIF